MASSAADSTNYYNASRKEPRTVYYLGVLRLKRDPEEIVVAKDLSSFSIFSRSTFDGAITFSAKAITGARQPGERICVTEKEKFNGKIYARATGKGYCAVMITELDFHDNAAQGHLGKTLAAFEAKFPLTDIQTRKDLPFDWPGLTALLNDAKKVHLTPLAQLNDDLGETQQVLYKTIQSALERGEKLELLVQKSEDLNIAAKSFYKGTKEQNSCCIIM